MENISPFFVKNMLKDILTEMSSVLTPFVKNPTSDFTSERKLGFVKMMNLSYYHQFNWWFIIDPPKGHCYCSPRRAVSQALILVRYNAVLLESSFLDSSACSFIYFCTASSVILPTVST